MEVHCDNEFHIVMDNYSIKQDSITWQLKHRFHVPTRQLHNTRMCQPNISFIALHTFTMHFGKISVNRGSKKFNFFHIMFRMKTMLMTIYNMTR